MKISMEVNGEWIELGDVTSFDLNDENDRSVHEYDVREVPSIEFDFILSPCLIYELMPPQNKPELS